MARILAFDWDRLEARMIVARTQGDEEVVVDQVAAVPLDLDAQEINSEALGAQLTKALASERFPKSQAFVAIGRSAIELRTMKLPPAPDDELPDMVRFQAMREFSSLNEESPLDFVSLGEAGQEPGEVMAAAIPLDLFQQVGESLSSQGHELAHSVMRPCSATSLALRRQPGARIGVTLVIAQQADSVELAIAKDGVVVFTRSFRLPPNWHPGETGEPLLGEVRRTLAAAQNQLGGASVDRIMMFGTESEHAGLCDRLRDRTKLDVVLLDPFEGIKVAGKKPDQPERFAALLGMLQDEAASIPPVIDFNNPRKRPKAESNRRQYVLYASTAATVLLGILFMIWWQYRSLDQKIAERQRAINVLSRENKKLQPAVNLAAKLNEWKKGDRNWLEELRHLSNDNLSPDDFRLVSFLARTQQDNTGVIEIRGRAKDLEAQQKVHNEWSDEHHDVILDDSIENKREDERYPLVFRTKVEIERSIPIIPLTSGPAKLQDPESPDANAKSDVINDSNTDEEKA